MPFAQWEFKKYEIAVGELLRLRDMLILNPVKFGF